MRNLVLVILFLAAGSAHAASVVLQTAVAEPEYDAIPEVLEIKQTCVAQVAAAKLLFQMKTDPEIAYGREVQRSRARPYAQRMHEMLMIAAQGTKIFFEREGLRNFFDLPYEKKLEIFTQLQNELDSIFKFS